MKLETTAEYDLMYRKIMYFLEMEAIHTLRLIYDRFSENSVLKVKAIGSLRKVLIMKGSDE